MGACHSGPEGGAGAGLGRPLAAAGAPAPQAFPEASAHPHAQRTFSPCTEVALPRGWESGLGRTLLTRGPLAFFAFQGMEGGREARGWEGPQPISRRASLLFSEIVVPPTAPQKADETASPCWGDSFSTPDGGEGSPLLRSQGGAWGGWTLAEPQGRGLLCSLWLWLPVPRPPPPTAL